MNTLADLSNTQVGVNTLANVLLVTVQFSFSNKKAVPAFAARLMRTETSTESEVRRRRRSGTMVIQPTEHVSLAELLQGLDTTGYLLTDAVYQERVDQRDPRKTFNMIRFEFCRSDWAVINPDIDEAQWELAVEGLKELCGQAIWRARAFLNPFYWDGRECADRHSISINLESRVPLRNPDGSPVLIWSLNEYGDRKKVPLRGHRSIRLNGDIHIYDVE
jgi:hypothetical protein